ncbi:MAG: YraN family protein [Nitrospirae bacterium]|nr:YraN family protein [Nitrospirota bacterium]
MRLGKEGEELAKKFLNKKGYKIIEQNYKTPIGEIDIIASDRETLVFIEVKTRESLEFGMPFEAVNYTKRNKISKAALLYLKRFKEKIPACRFDVLSICYKNNKSEFELIRDAFESSFKF